MNISLQRRHALVDLGGAFSHKIEYATLFFILSLKDIERPIELRYYPTNQICIDGLIQSMLFMITFI